MTFASALYEGHIRHRRFAEREHAFAYDLFMVWLDLGEAEALCARSPLWSARRFAPAWFRRRDFLPARPGTLRMAVLAELQERGVDPATVGPVRMLAHLRYWGLAFNPITIFYCYAPDGTTLRHLVLEVHNTPWNERHVYVLPVDDNARHAAALAKEFHVSPFMPMEMRYGFAFNTPGERLQFHMDVTRGEERAFDATLSLRRREATPAALNAVLLRYPWMTAKVVAGIYWEALRLLFGGVRFHAHPGPGADVKTKEKLP